MNNIYEKALEILQEDIEINKQTLEKKFKNIYNIKKLNDEEKIS